MVTYSRHSVARILMACYYGCFKLILESLGRNPIAADKGDFFILKMVYFVYSLELPPRGGNSNENTQYTFMLKKIEKISLFCLLTWRAMFNTH